MHLHITTSTTTSTPGVVERSFTVGEVPGVLWSPARPTPGAALLLMGHGGGLHKRAPGLVARAHQAVSRDGFHVAAIDAPGHGDRVRSAQDRRWVAAMVRAREEGEPLGPVLADYQGSLVERTVPEWQATLDALQSAAVVDPGVPVGYSGMTLASAVGISLAAADPRIRAAVLGAVLVHDTVLDGARRVTIPIEFLLPWDDGELDRASGLALFDAFASPDKTLHAFPGSHARVPAERVHTRFFARHLAGARPVAPGAPPGRTQTG